MPSSASGDRLDALRDVRHLSAGRGQRTLTFANGESDPGGRRLLGTQGRDKPARLACGNEGMT
jgi:hypothetical protein